MVKNSNEDVWIPNSACLKIRLQMLPLCFGYLNRPLAHIHISWISVQRNMTFYKHQHCKVADGTCWWNPGPVCPDNSRRRMHGTGRAGR